MLKILYENGVRCAAADTPASMKALMLARPTGAYTGARTIGRTRMFLYDLHMKRLANSYGNVAECEIKTERVKQLLMPSLRAAVADFVREQAAATELKISLLLTPPASGAADAPDISVYVEPIPVRSPPIVVEMRPHAPRAQPGTKSTDWVRLRAELEQGMASETDEVVMYSDAGDGAVSEGLSSNFGVVIDGALHTPPKDTVLFGTVFQLVEKLCTRHNVPLHFDAGVHVAQRAQWQAAFVASTTRGLLPIDELRFPDNDECATMHFESNELLERIRGWIQDEMLVESEPLLE